MRNDSSRCWRAPVRSPSEKSTWPNRAWVFAPSHSRYVRTAPGRLPRALAEPLVLMVAPLAPHLAEELWKRLGHDKSLAHGPFPVADPQYLVEDAVEYPVQVNGKVRGHVTVPADADADTLEAAALADDKVQAFINGATPKKVIVVAGRLVNIVV